MTDIAVSRRHIRILRRGGKYFIRDLESENGTFVSGEPISSNVEVEIYEGVPIVVGMSVICLGKRCLKHVMPFLDSIGLSNDISENSGVFKQHRTMTTQKIMELVYKVSDTLTQGLDIDVILYKILDHIFDFFRKIDRGVIILLDRQTEEYSNVVSKVIKPSAHTTALFNEDVVDRVIEEGKGIMFPDPDAEGQDDLEDTLKLSEIQSVICVPLISGSQIRGVIYVDSLREPYGFRKEDLSLFTDLGRRAALGIENALFYASLEK